MLGALKRLLTGGPDPRVAARQEADDIIRQAEREADDLRRSAQDAAEEERERSRSAARKSRRDAQREQQKAEDRLSRREDALEERARDLDVREGALAERDAALRERDGELRDRAADLDEAISGIDDERRQRLEEVSSLTGDEAREMLLEQIEREIGDEADRMVRVAQARAKEEAEERARQIISTAIQRVSSDVTTESTVSVVQIPGDEMKGRIIGREGRNIRALEAAIGCDLIIDDTPDVVTVSGFDPVRREVGRLSLSRLVADGRIHPARIEETVDKAQRDVDRIIRESGEEAAIEAHCTGMPRDILDIFGRLRFRTSYGQNQLRHAVETAHIGAMIAEEMHADVEVARRGSLLHDLGKAIDHEVEGTHAIIGADLARRFKMSESIAHCIEAHHDEVELESVEAVIVQIADAISGGRPGARRESVERYIERLRSLEEIATSFEGVGSAFAIQAGREVRVLVDPDEVDDLGSMRLSRDISKKIEESLTYPGQIRVTVLRETRAAAYAR